MTKSLIDHEPLLIIEKVIEAISFPCYISIDFAGFVHTTKEDHTIKFVWPSWNTGIKQSNKMNWFFVETTEGRTQIKNHFKSMDLPLLQENWFNAHDDVSDFSSSGFSFRRLVSIIFYVEPATPLIKKLIDQSY